LKVIKTILHNERGWVSRR